MQEAIIYRTMGEPAPSEWVDMTEAEELELEAMLADPRTIPTRDKAKEIIDLLDHEIAGITAQLDATQVEAGLCPLPPERAAWARRASYARSMKINQRHKVHQRDKELRGQKAVTAPSGKKAPEVLLAKHERMKVEAEAKKEAKRLEGETRQLELQTRQMEIKNARTFSVQFQSVAKRLLSAETYEAIEAEAALRVQVAKEHPGQ